MRLIDADELKIYISTTFCDTCKRDKGVCSSCAFDDVFIAIEDAPTIDAEPVVRCKDCKNAGRKMGTHYHCEQQMSWHEEEYFCSYGEVYHARGSKILGKEAECIIDEANAYRGEEMTREEAIDCLNGLKIYLKTEHIDQEAIDMAIEALQAEPVKHGKWLHEGFDYMTEQECWSRLPCFCSECKQETKAYFHNYCPNCGAKMDK